MSFKLKTLIVFDTNSLRNTEAGDIAYSSFSFGHPYHAIEQFVNDNGLNDRVSFVVPGLVIEELKQQKQRSYRRDIEELKRIYQRLTGLPHIGDAELRLPDEAFSCAEHIENAAREYITANGVNLLELQDEHAASMLKSMLAKVVGRDTPKSPFPISGKYYKDAGFKDSLIWETLMHFESVSEFDKVIFFSRDGDYKDNCIEDFKTKFQRHIDILKDETLVIAELQKDYGNYIDNKKIYEYAQTDYFDDYMRDLLTPATYVEVDGENLRIENYSIANHCARVEMEADAEGDFISPVIFSEIVISTTRKVEKLEVPVTMRTILSDAEYMEIGETDFEPKIT